MRANAVASMEDHRDRAHRRWVVTPAGSAAANPPAGRKRPWTPTASPFRSRSVNAVSTLATGQPVVATSSSTVAAAEDQLAADPSGRLADIGQSRGGTAATRPGSPDGRPEPRSSMSCGIPATIRAPSGKLAQERQAALGRRRIEWPRDEEAVPSLLERPRRGDQCAAARRCLDDHGGIGQTADDPVPSRERAPCRLDVGGQLRDDGAAGIDDRRGQPAVRQRVQDARVRSR